MKSFVTLASVALVSLLSCIATAATQPATAQWSTTVPDTFAGTSAIAIDSQNNLVIGSQGLLYSTDTGKGFLTKYDDSGEQTWQREFQRRFIYGVTVDDVGNTYVTGNAFEGPFARMIWMGKYSPDGEELWTDSHFEGYDVSRGLVRDATGNLYSTGTAREAISYGNYTDRDMVLRKWSPTGAILWTKEFGTETGDEGYHLAIDAAQNLYVVGNTDGISTSGEFIQNGSVLLTKFSTDGDLLWERTISGTDNVYENAFAVDAMGNIFVGGSAEGQIGDAAIGGADAFVSHWDTDGNLIWTKQFGTAHSDAVTGLSIGVNQSLFISGYAGSQNINNQGHTYLSQLDYQGDEHWTTKTQLFADRKLINEITPDQFGNLYVTGLRGLRAYDGFVELLTFPSDADFDNDGDVDGRDFLAWQRGFGKLDATLADGDANGDALVNAEDLAIWQEQYQNGQTLAANVAVPEPSTLALMVCAILFTARSTKLR